MTFMLCVLFILNGIAASIGLHSTSTFTGGTICIGIVFILHLLKSKRLVTAMCSVFLLYSIVPLWPMQMIGGLPLSNWRGESFPSEAIFEAISYYCVVFTLFCLTVLLVSGFFKIQKNSVHPPPPSPFEYATVQSTFPRVVAIVLGLCILSVVAGTSRDQWILQAGLGDRFLMQATSISATAAYAFNLEWRRQNGLRLQLIDHFVLLASCVVALQGFRFMLVSSAIILLISYRTTLNLRVTSLIKLTLGASLLYCLLIVGMGTRAIAGSRGISAFEAIKELDIASLSLFIGAPEQTVMLALKAFLETPISMLYGQTYVDSIVRILPNAIHTTLYDTIRPQDVILSEFIWVSNWFRTSNLNIGAHILLEGILNFGKVWGGGVVLLLAAFLPWLDYSATVLRKNTAFLYAVGAFSYSAIWYGSGTFFKYVAFFIAVYLCLSFASQLLQNARPHPHGPDTF